MPTIDDILLRLNLRWNKCGEFEPKTATSIEQKEIENLIQDTYEKHAKLHGESCRTLCRLTHLIYLKRQLFELSSSSVALDASQSWLLYWTLHAFRLLSIQLTDETVIGSIKLLKSLQSINGGFGGGPKQLPHLATTYAAVNAICELQTIESYEIINRRQLYLWLLSLKQSDGAFRMHDCGETDVRGCYCALSVAHLCNVLDDKLTQSTAQWILRCQTYEGGFGGAPGLEAHGGYTFCAVAALSILNKLDLLDIPKLLRWTVNRQMSLEGGFQGRTNKLVDSCYSFWVGGIFALIQSHISSAPLDDWLFDSSSLQDYLLICCQRYPPLMPESKNHDPLDCDFGGLIDKPGKPVDLYHSCYALSGLALCLHPREAGGVHTADQEECEDLEVIEPLFNITKIACDSARQYFSRLSHPFNSS